MNILEEIIAGLPTNSRQRLELEKFRLKSAADDAKIKALEAQLAAFQPVSGVKPEAIKILRILFQRNDLIDLPEIALLFEGYESEAKYHLEKLSEIDFVRDVTGADRYELRPKGREFVIKNGLA